MFSFLKKYYKKAKKRRRPRLLNWKGILLIIILVISLELLFLPNQKGEPIFKDILAKITPGELVELTNKRRLSREINDLTVNSQLVEAAQMKANHMAKNEYFAHTSPDGTEPWHWFDKAGYSYEHAGENLAVNFTKSQQVDKAWMESPKHKENIMKKEFEEIGIATAKGIYEGEESTYVVQLFGTKVSQETPDLSSPEEETEQEDGEQILGDQEEKTEPTESSTPSQDSKQEKEEEELPKEQDPQKQTNEQEEPTKQEGEQKDSKNEDKKEEQSFAYIENREESSPNLTVGTPQETIEEKPQKAAHLSLWQRITSSPSKAFSYLLFITGGVFIYSSLLQLTITPKLNLPAVVINETIILIAVFSTILANHYVLEIINILG